VFITIWIKNLKLDTLQNGDEYQTYIWWRGQNNWKDNQRQLNQNWVRRDIQGRMQSKTGDDD